MFVCKHLSPKQTECCGFWTHFQTFSRHFLHFLIRNGSFNSALKSRLHAVTPGLITDKPATITKTCIGQQWRDQGVSYGRETLYYGVYWGYEKR